MKFDLDRLLAHQLTLLFHWQQLLIGSRDQHHLFNLPLLRKFKLIKAILLLYQTEM
jgi:hypothetical protein